MGGGLYFNYSSNTTVGNTIIDGNTAGTSPDVDGRIIGGDGDFTSNGNNLIGETDGSSGWVSSDLTGTVATPLDPMLGPLANNGGPTQTMALLPGSPAIDAGNNALIPSGVTTDQRGTDDPRIVNGTVDIGAFESSGFTIAVTSGSGQAKGGWPTSIAFTAPLVVTVTANNSKEPVAGGLVTFTPPASGATAVLTGSPATIGASVTATRNGVAGSYTVSATARGAPVSASFKPTNVVLVSIAVSPGNPELAEGIAGQFTATGTYADGSTGDLTDYVTWSSATMSVATISTGGLATALVPGTSAITASRAGVTSPADTLTVIAPSFVVNTTADEFGFSDGTTSFREAITFANAHPGPNTITFALPAGSTTIHLLSPLPAITNPVVIDGTSQPGFAGTPLVDLTGESLAISAAVTVRSVAFDGIAFGSAAVPEVLALPSVPFTASGVGPASAIDSYPFSTTTGEDLTAVVQAQGVTTRLSLLDATGNVLMSSDGESAAGGDDLINLYVSPGTYSLEVQNLGGAGTYSLTATASLATSPLVPLANGDFQVISSIVPGDFNGDGHLDLAVANQGSVLYYAGSVSVLLGHGDGTFAPAVTYHLDENPIAIVAGDFTGDSHLDLAFADEDYYVGGIQLTYSTSALLGHGDGTFGHEVTVGYQNKNFGTAIAAADFTENGHLDLAVTEQSSATVAVLESLGDGTFIDPTQLATTPQATPLVADVNGDGTPDVLVVNSTGNILYRQGIPGQPGSFLPPVTVNPGNPSRDIAWLPNTSQGPVLASLDAQDDAILFYVYRYGGFVQLSGSLPTGQFPAQIIAAQLSSNGLDDLVVRDAGDGTLTVYLGSWFRSRSLGAASPLDPPIFTPAFILPVGLGVSDVHAVDTTGSGVLNLVVTNKLTGEVSVLRNVGGGAFAPVVPYRAGTGFSVVSPGSTPEVTGFDATAGVAVGPLTPGAPPIS